MLLCIHYNYSKLINEHIKTKRNIMANTQIKQSTQTTMVDEQILVVKRAELFRKEPAWSGLKKVNFDEYLKIINEKKEFQTRSIMETDPHYKQIIPYLVFEHDNHFFLMQRAAQATEQRLQNKYSLGIGGHIRQEDMGTDSLFDWAKREFHEEVNYTDSFDIEPLGILNDDSNDVGKVHIGFVFLLRGKTDAISVKSELKSGVLYDLSQMKAYFPHMESWSQLVFEFLVSQNN
jgi:predicted NUDIX family phosphoesterase